MDDKRKEVNAYLYKTVHVDEGERAILVGVSLPHLQRWELEDNLFELKQLARTAGVTVVGELVQERRQINPTYFIGSGKVEELIQMIRALNVSSIIFDDDLSPAQARNLEKATGAKIVDRSLLILDIFAQHARTREAKTQVELAQLQYLLPRLTRQWSHLSRQVGGIGTKGPGETQLETDRRLIRNRIQVLSRALNRIDRQRATRRKRRQHVFKAALIGYTNVGKSTLMNLLSGAGVPVENQLFATLDSTVRRVWLDENHQILLSDTVGFIRKLPHHLVASFKSTLDEVREADLLLHVVDVAHPAFRQQIATVNQVLDELKVGDKPVLMVFNKIDLVREKQLIGLLRQEYPASVFVSAARQIRIGYLKQALIEFIDSHFVEDQVDIPLTLSGLVNRVYELAQVKETTYSDHSVRLRFRASIPNRARILRMVQREVHAFKASLRS